MFLFISQIGFNQSKSVKWWNILYLSHIDNQREFEHPIKVHILIVCQVLERALRAVLGDHGAVARVVTQPIEGLQVRVRLFLQLQRYGGLCQGQTSDIGVGLCPCIMYIFDSCICL